MNLTDEIDNEDVLFQFDVSDALKGTHSHVFPSRPSQQALPTATQSTPSHQFSEMQHPRRSLTSLTDTTDTEGFLNVVDSVQDGKGKGVSQPMLIRRTTNHNQHDLFASSLDSTFSSGTSLFLDRSIPILSPSSFTSSSADVFSVQTPNSVIEQGRMLVNNRTPFDGNVPVVNDPGSEDNPSVWKGKARECSPPILPPLVFSPTLAAGSEDWLPFMRGSTPGPSSYNSSLATRCESPGELITPVSRLAENMMDIASPSEPIIRRIPSRRRSFSNLSLHSTRSVAARSLSRAKVKLQSSCPSNIARKLLFRKRVDALEGSSGGCTTPEDGVVDMDFPGSPSVGQGSCFLPGCVDLRTIVHDDSMSAQTAPFDISHVASLYAQPDSLTGRPTDAVKGRSYSSPFPLGSSLLDIISSPELDVFSPVRVDVRDFFDELLPRELKLQIFSLLVSVHDADFQRIAGRNWTALKASSTKNKWVGRDRGIRELIKLGRVSKTWRSLVFDGQLWRELDLSSFPKMPSSIVAHIAANAGPFITVMNMTGHSRLLPATLLDISNDLCLDSAPAETLPHTQLTCINLQGCSAVTTRSLHHLLIRSPLLEKLSVKGLKAVTNTTCDVLSVYCRRLLTLDMSRCSNLDGEGIRHMASAALTRGDIIPLRELRLSGLKQVTDTVMSVLGNVAPHLEVLDLSYVGSLHNSAIDAFVACAEDDDDRYATVLLSSREVGREAGDSAKYRRRVTRLRHLSLSSCPLLTDIAASHLAHTVPRLEYLEMGGIGTELREDGLVRLFNTTPHIRRVDLEDASEITNAVIEALTPDVEQSSDGAPQPGHALEHLTVSYAINISNDAFSALIQACTRLKVLEADSTRLSGSLIKEFVGLCRQRDMTDAKVVAVDCRNVGDNVMKDIASCVRPRLGWRSHDAKKLAYLDARDNEQLDVGQDECDEKRVVLKTFYSWQVVDLVKAAREQKQRMKRSSTVDDLQMSSGKIRWWASGSRRLPAGTNTPTLFDTNTDRDGCTIM